MWQVRRGWGPYGSHLDVASHEKGEERGRGYPKVALRLSRLELQGGGDLHKEGGGPKIGNDPLEGKTPRKIYLLRRVHPAECTPLLVPSWIYTPTRILV